MPMRMGAKRTAQKYIIDPLDRIRAGDLQVTMFGYSLSRYQLRHKGSGLVVGAQRAFDHSNSHRGMRGYLLTQQIL